MMLITFLNRKENGPNVPLQPWKKSIQNKCSNRVSSGITMTPNKHYLQIPIDNFPELKMALQY